MAGVSYPLNPRASRCQSASLPDRYHFQPAHRALLRKEGVGAGPLASGKQAGAQSPLSHRGLPAQPSDGQSTPTALEAARSINSHIGLARHAEEGGAGIPMLEG